MADCVSDAGIGDAATGEASASSKELKSDNEEMLMQINDCSDAGKGKSFFWLFENISCQSVAFLEEQNWQM